MEEWIEDGKYIVARSEAEMDGIEIGVDNNKPSWSKTSYILSVCFSHSILKGSYRVNLPMYWTKDYNIHAKFSLLGVK